MAISFRFHSDSFCDYGKPFRRTMSCESYGVEVISDMQDIMIVVFFFFNGKC